MDFFFDCPSCKGSLVADENCIGESTACPHCSKWIQVPISESISRPIQSSQNEGVPARMVIDSILVRELEDARTQYRKLKAEYSELEVKIAKTGGTTSAPQTAETEKQLAEGPGRLEQLSQQLEAVLKERDILAKEVAEMKTALQKAHKESEKEKIKNESALENANRELVEIRTQLGATGSERGLIASELERAKKAAKTEHDEFLKEKKKLSAQAESTQRELTAMREKLAQTESLHKQVANELADTKRALDASRDTLNSGQKAYAEALDKANKELVTLRAKSGETDSSRARLESELAQFKTATEAGRRENEALRNESGKAVQELKSLLEASEKKSAKLDAECKTLHFNIEKGSSELAAKREQLHKIRNEQQVTVDAGERMKRELNEVRTQLSSLQNERDNYAGEVLQLRAKIQESTLLMEKSAANQVRLQEELKTARTEVSSIQSKMKEMVQENQNLSAKSGETGKLLIDTQKQLEATAKECVALKTALEQVTKERDQHGRDLNQLNAMVARLQGQMDASKLNNNELRQANEQVKKELMQARQHLASWQKENDSLEAILTSLENQLTGALKQINEQRSKPLEAA